MNRQPYRTPPRWWSPQLSSFWIRVWRPLRRRRGSWMHGLSDIEVRGLEHLRGAVDRDQGVLITPNHPTHADPFALLEAADQLGQPFYFMTAWQVFAMTHRLGRRVLRQHGCFSINREGHDLRALRQAVNILGHGRHPLVIFPEGEVFHLNDRVTHFRQGAATAALLAARRSRRPVACVPCGLKFEYVESPEPELTRLMDRLEQKLTWTPRSDVPLVRRIRRFAEGLVQLKEVEFLGAARSGRLDERMSELIAVILGRLEDRYQVSVPRSTVPERVKQLRHRVIERLESTPATDPRSLQSKQDLDDLLLVMQLFSYPIDYLAESPSIERLAETLDKLEEDVLGVRTARNRGTRRAIISFGEPVLVEPSPQARPRAAEVTAVLHARVQDLLDGINARRPACAASPQPVISPQENASGWLQPATT